MTFGAVAALGTLPLAPCKIIGSVCGTPKLPPAEAKLRTLDVVRSCRCTGHPAFCIASRMRGALLPTAAMLRHCSTFSATVLAAAAAFWTACRAACAVLRCCGVAVAAAAGSSAGLHQWQQHQVSSHFRA